MFHVAGYNDNCPKNQNSWYEYKQDILNGTNSYKDKGGLPLDVRAAILPVNNNLCKRENLSKCLHGRTQNRNESFNGTIWNRVPPANHVGIDILSLGGSDAIVHFNDVHIEPVDNMMKGLQI